MPSLRSRLLRILVRRFNFFADRNLSVPEMRRAIDSSTRFQRLPRGAAVRAMSAGAVPAERTWSEGAPDDRALLYFHGGAFLFGSPATHRSLVGRLAIAGGTPAVSVDYRLAPEFPFPAAVEDAVAAYRFLLRSGIAPRKIVAAGDSAGGNLALVLLLALREAGEPLPAAAVCLSPVTDFTFSGDSFRTKAAADPIFPKGVSLPVGLYAGSADPRHPLLSPLYGDLRGLPPVLFHVGEDEVLLDDSTRAAEKIRAAGGQAQVVVWPGMWHVFQALAPLIPEADRSIRQIGNFIREKQAG